MVDHRLLTLACTLLLLASACVGGSNQTRTLVDQDRDAADPRQAAGFSDSTGALVGVVVDEELVPVPEAFVEVGGIGTAADVEGRFGVGFLTPGEYQVNANAAGFHNASQIVQIEAGQTTDVALSLRRLPSDASFHSSLTQRGLMGCAVAARAATTPGEASVCGVFSLLLGLKTVDNFKLYWELTTPTAEWQGLVRETRWVANQALGRGFRLAWEVAECTNQPGLAFSIDAGYSPLRSESNATQLAQIVDYATKHYGEVCANQLNAVPRFCNADGCWIQTRSFPYASTLGSSYPVDGAAYFQQTFEQVLTSFYGAPAPVGYTAFADA